MTWRSFKELVESFGVTDDFRISYIDISGSTLAKNTLIMVDTKEKEFYVED